MYNLYTEQERREWRGYSVWKRLGIAFRRVFSIQMLLYQYLDRRYKVLPFVVTDIFYLVFGLFIGAVAILELSAGQFSAAPVQLLWAVCCVVTPVIRRLLIIGRDRYAFALWVAKIVMVSTATILGAINLHRLLS